jgi:hypothetical protein
MLLWQEEFPSSYRVPWGVVRMVESGMIEDLSWRNDPSPSFGARLKDKNWVRLWVEHPTPEKRLGWGDRFTIVVQPEPAIPFGWKMLGTEDATEALTWLAEIIRMKGPRCRFKVQA